MVIMKYYLNALTLLKMQMTLKDRLQYQEIPMMKNWFAESLVIETIQILLFDTVSE